MSHLPMARETAGVAAGGHRHRFSFLRTGTIISAIESAQGFEQTQEMEGQIGKHHLLARVFWR